MWIIMLLRKFWHFGPKKLKFWPKSDFFLGFLVKIFKNKFIKKVRKHPGGFSHWHDIRICTCLLGHFFARFGIAIRGFSSEMKEPKLHKLGVFWANYCKKHPIWSKLGAFLLKMVYWWVGNLAKNWYRESQIFEVWQAHPCTILVKAYTPREKTFPRYTHLDGFGKFLVIFVQKYFLPLLKKCGPKNHLFGNFSKIWFLARNLTIWIDSSWNSLSKIVYFYMKSLFPKPLTSVTPDM